MSRTDQISASLLSAASDLLAAEGASALTVRRIAAQAGVSTMNVYSRFGSKDGVVEQLFVEGFRRLAATMTGTVPSGDPVVDLLLCGCAYRDFALANPTLYGIMFERAVPDFEPSEAALQVAHGTLMQLADRIRAAMDAGALIEADPLQTAACIWGTCHGIMSLELKEIGTIVDWESAYRQACRMMVDGLAPTDDRLSAGPAVTEARRTRDTRALVADPGPSDG